MTINLSNHLADNNFKRMYIQFWDEDNIFIIKVFNWAIGSSGCPQYIFDEIINNIDDELEKEYIKSNHIGNLGQIMGLLEMSDEKYNNDIKFIKELDGTLLCDVINKICVNYCKFI